MKKNFFSVLLLLFFAGCLPPGTPPPGNITVNTETIPLTREEKRERMITELAAVLLQTVPGGAIRLRADAASVTEMNAVIRECAKITGIYSGSDSNWLIYSHCTDSEWIVELVHGSEVVHTIRLQR